MKFSSSAVENAVQKNCHRQRGKKGSKEEPENREMAEKQVVTKRKENTQGGENSQRCRGR